MYFKIMVILKAIKKCKLSSTHLSLFLVLLLLSFHPEQQLKVKNQFNSTKRLSRNKLKIYPSYIIKKFI